MASIHIAPFKTRWYPLYDTTFTLHRLSPLYHGADSSSFLDNPTLTKHARRFHDLLKGEVLRGVRVGLDLGNDDALGKAGALLECNWILLGDEDSWADTHPQKQGDQADAPILESEDSRGVYIEVVYERSTYIAILLRTPSAFGLTDVDGFTHLPLLLSRMPVALRETLLDYLATNFDVGYSALTLSPLFLESSLEILLEQLSMDSDAEVNGLSSQEVINVIKDIQITLSFPPPTAPSLRSLDISLSKDDVLRFIAQGQPLMKAQSKNVQEQQPSANRDWSESSGKNPTGPFMCALSHHVRCYLALPMSHPGVRLSRIACGAFVLGAEGKVKIFRPSAGFDETEPSYIATQAFISRLVKRAKDKPMLGTTDG